MHQARACLLCTRSACYRRPQTGRTAHPRGGAVTAQRTTRCWQAPVWARPAPGCNPGACPGAASRSAAEGTGLDAREPPSRLLRCLARRKHSTQKDWCRPSSSALGSGPTPTGEAAQCGAESRSQAGAGGRNHAYRQKRECVAEDPAVWGENETRGEHALAVVISDERSVRGCAPDATLLGGGAGRGAAPAQPIVLVQRWPPHRQRLLATPWLIAHGVRSEE